MLDLCAGPGIKTGQIAARMGDRGEVISVELDPTAPPKSPPRRSRLGLRSVTVIEADATDGGDGRRASTASCSTRPARTSARSPRARTPAGANRRRRSSAWSRSRSGRCSAPPRLLRPGGTLVYSTCTISRRENEDRVAALLAAAGRGRGRRRSSSTTSAPARPGLASPLEPRCLQLRPDRDRTTGFFIARLKRA